MTDRADAPALVTGGAGFVGTNVAARLLSEGRRVIVYDNLSRPGVEHNARWLQQRYGERVELRVADVGDARELAMAVGEAALVFHFAAQVAVTTSLDDPLADFDSNLRGTLHVLEAARRAPAAPGVVFTSTNKVYGALSDVLLEDHGLRRQPRDGHLRTAGIGEDRPLDFHSPYGCSKGGADQYVLDYARSFGVPTLVLRMSCIYGPHQFGTEDQGWVAHFMLRALERRPITLYGDGRQVRDILFVDDLVDALLLCGANVRALAGCAFNIGGGPANTISLLELVERIARLAGQRPPLAREPARTGDQGWYCSDTRRLAAATGWTPRTGIDQGLERLHAWLLSHRVAATGASAVRTHAA